MGHPSAPNSNGRPRNRGAIRTHLGRKRVGPRTRDASGAVVRMRSPSAKRDEDLFDRLFGVFQTAFDAAAEREFAGLAFQQKPVVLDGGVERRPAAEEVGLF